MKLAIFAVIASMFVFSAAHAAGDAPATAGADKAAMLSESDCKDALAKCTDDACKSELAAKGCKAVEETK